MPISDLQPTKSTTDDIIISGNVLVLLQTWGGVSCGGCCSGCRKRNSDEKDSSNDTAFCCVNPEKYPVTSSNLTNHENIRILLREPHKERKTRNSQHDS